MTQKEKAQFIPFNAINEFMRNDFRLIVVRETLLSLDKLERKFSAPVDQLTKKHVTVAGLRNSTKAPATVRAVATIKPFEKQPKLVAVILQAWCQIHLELRQLIYELLTDRGWKLLPADFDRTKLPGFLTRWPAEDDYETLYDAFVQANPDFDASIDQTSLMVVWLSGRLPIDKVQKESLENPDLSDQTGDTE